DSLRSSHTSHDINRLLYHPSILPFFFFYSPATTQLYTLSLHDALPILNTHNNVSGNVNFHLFIDPKNVPNDSSTETLNVGIGNQQISRKVNVQYTAINPSTVSNVGTANGEAFITQTNFTDHKVTSVVYVNTLDYNYKIILLSLRFTQLFM